MLQANIITLYTAGEATGRRINICKTKTQMFENKTIEEHMKVGNKDLENFTEFEYLCSLLS